MFLISYRSLFPDRIWYRHYWLGFVFVVSFLACDSQPSFQPAEFCILDVHLLDGMGSEPVQTDLLIAGDSIYYIGAIDTSEIQAEKIISGDGRYLAPAFIDLHAHGDPLISENFNNFLAQGVGTIVLGQDGSSPDYPFAGLNAFRTWADSASKTPLDVNVLSFVGHGSTRRKFVADDKATADEITQMESYIRQSLQDGAWGMSTGLEYYPGLNADSTELHALARIVGQNEGMVMSHMRSEDNDQIEKAIDELVQQGRYCPVHISHLKVVYGKGEQRAQEILTQIKAAKDNGIQISADLYPYLASYTGIGIVFPTWCKTKEQFESAKQNRIQELRMYLENRIKQRNGPEATLFCSGPYTGKTLAEVAAEEGKHYVDILMELGPVGTSGAYFVMNEELQNTFIKDPSIAFCTDGSPTMWHPRGYGTYAKIIEAYTVNQNLLDLPLAIYKMTGLPAEILKLEDRGKIQVGAKADMVLFDPENVQATADYVNPRSLAKGFDLVWINGNLAWDGQRVSRSGKLLLKE